VDLPHVTLRAGTLDGVVPRRVLNFPALPMELFEDLFEVFVWVLPPVTHCKPFAQ
jgi:hypothetical protein